MKLTTAVVFVFRVNPENLYAVVFASGQLTHGCSIARGGLQNKGVGVDIPEVNELIKLPNSKLTSKEKSLRDLRDLRGKVNLL